MKTPSLFQCSLGTLVLAFGVLGSMFSVRRSTFLLSSLVLLHGQSFMAAGMRLYLRLIHEQFARGPQQPLLVNIGGQVLHVTRFTARNEDRVKAFANHRLLNPPFYQRKSATTVPGSVVAVPYLNTVPLERQRVSGNQQFLVNTLIP